MSKTEIQNLIQRKAIKYNIDPAFFDAIIRVESGYNPDARNPISGAHGLGQIMPVVKQEYENMTGNTISWIYDPEQNLEVAGWYLGKRIPQMLRDFGKKVTTRNLIWAYNAGIGNVVEGKLPQETKEYFEKVDQTYPFLEYHIGKNPVKKKYHNADMDIGYRDDVPNIFLTPPNESEK